MVTIIEDPKIAAVSIIILFAALLFYFAFKYERAMPSLNFYSKFANRADCKLIHNLKAIILRLSRCYLDGSSSAEYGAA